MTRAAAAPKNGRDVFVKGRTGLVRSGCVKCRQYQSQDRDGQSKPSGKALETDRSQLTPYDGTLRRSCLLPCDWESVNKGIFVWLATHAVAMRDARTADCLTLGCR